MRTTIRRLNSFKRDWKREAKGKSPEYVQKLDAELAAAVSWWPTLRCLRDMPITRCLEPGRAIGIATFGPTL
jgi:hypothetical protein